jgi:hypothetical protein
MSNADFLHHLRRKKVSMQRVQNKVQETDRELSETLIRRIELINILLAEFGVFKHVKSLANLLHKPKF